MPGQAEPFFDTMADGYDTLEPWYEHLYATLHALLRSELTPPADTPRARALDAGCGTGFQAAILDEMGYAVHGLDLSRVLLRGARERLLRAPLVQGDVQTLPYRDGGFDAATCCGSTLSYVDDAPQALAEIARVLRPGGRLLIECEGRWSLDLAWAWLSGLLGDPLGYELTPGEVWRAATTPRDRECRLRYPGYGTLRLFSAAELARLLRAAGLEPVRVWGIHSITNLLPSTVLHRAHLGRRVAAVYRALRGADRALAARWPAVRLANSLVVLARKSPPKSPTGATPGGGR
jgi:MPBQ/MSBQ methyltransferase